MSLALESKFSRWAARSARMIAVAAFCLIGAASSAPAEDGGFPGFLMHLFGGQPAAKPQDTVPPAAERVARKPHKKVRDFVPATATRTPGAPGGAPLQASFFVYVLGDSLGVNVADGLSDAFSDRPEVSIVDRARDSSGLVRDDYYDWPKAATDLSAGKDKIDYVVVLLGINDLQPLKDGSETLDPLSEKWRELYGQRIDRIVAPFRAAHISVAWVGLPPMRSDRFNAQAAKLDEIYKDRAEKDGAKYIDVWDAFADQNGQYDAFGPNIDGQRVKLRGVDGIHFTKAGSRKIAHFLEAEIRRSLNKDRPTNEVAGLPPDIEQAADDINAQIRREAGASSETAAPKSLVKPLAGPILSLTARPISPGGVLESRDSKSTAEAGAIARVFKLGEPVPRRVGRADEFAWPRL